MVEKLTTQEFIYKAKEIDGRIYSNNNLKKYLNNLKRIYIKDLNDRIY